MMSPDDVRRARFYVWSLWGIALVALAMITFGDTAKREPGIGIAVLGSIAIILYLVTWRDRGGHWLLVVFSIGLAFSEGGFSAAGLPVNSLLPVMVIVAWSVAIFVVGERLRRIGWFAP